MRHINKYFKMNNVKTVTTSYIVSIDYHLRYFISLKLLYKTAKSKNILFKVKISIRKIILLNKIVN